MILKPKKFNKTRFFKLAFLPVTFAILVFVSSLSASVDNRIRPDKAQSAQCIRIVHALERYHYLGKKLNDPLSAVIFSHFIKQLDPRKQIFTIKEIESFKKYEYRLDDELKDGILNSAFDIFNTYLLHSKERLEFMSALIPEWEKHFDFKKPESIIISDDLRKWQADVDALHILWKKDLKNHIISLILDGQDTDTITQTLEKTYANRLQRLSQTESSDVFQLFMNSVTSSFDPHTQYFPPRVSEDFDIHMSKSLEGIGAVLQNEYEYTKVVRLIPKGPADKSNLLMPGDKIIGVGQGESGEIKDTVGQRIDHVVKLIRGPKNTFVRLKIIPAKKKDSTRTIRIRRDRVKLEEQSAQKKVFTMDHNGKTLKIGVIDIPDFYIDFNAYHSGDPNYKSTTKDVQRILGELKTEHIDGLIIDLRDNGGGALQEASQLTGLFLKRGPTVQIKTKSRTTRLYDDDPAIEYTGPLVVLINRMSASASEIFAGAIKDYHRGIIVGSRSYGKGTVQELQPLGKGKLKLTSAKYYRVSGESTQHQGIIPDLEYPPLYKIDETGESSLDGSLPWDKTESTVYRPYRDLNLIFPLIRDRYLKRSVNDPGILYLKKWTQLTSEFDSRTVVSLELDTRKAMKAQFEKKEADLENEYASLTKPADSDEKPLDESRETDFNKILIKQTYLVLADFIDLSKQFGYAWQ